MIQSLRPSRLAGRTLRFTWTAGPKVPVTHERQFHADDTAWHPVQGRLEELSPAAAHA